MASPLRKESDRTTEEFPPSPPATEDSASVSSTSDAGPVAFPLPPPTTIPEIQDQDKTTPDSHVPRDPRLIRLTGVHPFNVEAPLSDLFKEGFLTSPELFFVRNHGAVPEVQDADIPDWEFVVEGLVENPLKITLAELMADYENVTYPVTLVCAGNRRKEQNMVKKSKGFSWGPAGLSTALFTGVVMSDIIKKARPTRKAKYVCMEGADKLPNGSYGTSVKLNWIMDPNRGIMLAHGMNGEMLRPDHGKPLRAVIPGQIGGRSVKWLKKLIITSEPSDNWYHIYDNRVLPTSVSPEEAANDPSWWTDDRYAIYELSNNSAIACPEHGEQLKLSETPSNYSLRGYAYGGGGRRITRVEISLDKARTWRLADIDYPEDTYREADEDVELLGGRLDMSWRETSFCWCFWNLDVAVKELESAQDILVRSMDEAMSIQPRDMYWSVMGMMNNPWFRVTISQENGFLRFEHPTQPALMPGGWMERVKKAGGNLTNGFWGERVGDEPEPVPQDQEADAVKMTSDDVKEVITIDDMKKHEDKSNPWFVVNGEVFNGTSYLEEHPGGAQSIEAAAGADVTDEFLAIHSDTARKMMADFHIGTLDENARKILGDDTQVKDENAEPRTVFLEPRSWNTALLESKIEASWDTRLFTFKLDNEGQSLGLPTGQHLMIRLRDPATREIIIRAYTPISHEESKGSLDVLVKVYFDTAERKGGKMSQALDSLPMGHGVDFKGPIGKFKYMGHGRCTINDKERHVDTFVMICGGTGVTPIFQVFRAIMTDQNDPTHCIVLNGNRLVEDILCREDLDRHAQENEEKCKLVHTLSNAPEHWDGLRGRITAPFIQEHAPLGKNMMALICGPEALETSVHSALKDQGWKDEDILFF